MQPGDYVETTRRFRSPHTIQRGTRGSVVSLDGDWITVEVPDGSRFQILTDSVTTLLKKRECESLPVG